MKSRHEKSDIIDELLKASKESVVDEEYLEAFEERMKVREEEFEKEARENKIDEEFLNFTYG